MAKKTSKLEARETMGLRIRPAYKALLQKEAAKEDFSTNKLVERILVEWLRSRGVLK